MTAHVVQQVLDQVQTMLRTAAVLPSSSVYLDRVETIGEAATGEAIDIVEARENVKALTVSAPHSLQRSVYVKVTAMCAKTGGGHGRRARELCALIEETLLAEPANLNGVAKGRVWLHQADYRDDGDAQRPIGERSMLFECRVHTKSNDPRISI